MRADDHRMISILYDPASYTHQSHLPDLFLASDIREDTLLNFWLLKKGKLQELPPSWQTTDPTLSQLLFSWHLIPICAHLIGGYLLRDRLPHHGVILMSDPQLLAFISLPLPHQIIIDKLCSPIDTISCGIGFILSQFPELPTALNQRLMLLFPYGIAPQRFPALKTLNHTNLIRMALIYAHHYN